MVTAGLLTLLPVLAFGGIPGTEATDRFEPRLQRDLVGFEDFDFDSGWFPMDSPVQLRFYAHAADSIEIEMLGSGIYDWGAETIAFEGELMAGTFAIDVGLQLQASVRFDLGAGLQWESDILGPYDYAIISDALYTPYLLPGNPERPVVIDDQTDGITVASVPIVPDIIIASGNLDIDVAADITASLEGVRIEATTEGDGAIVDAEWVPSPLTAPPGADPLMVEGVMVADMQTAPVLIVRPHLVMSILGVDYEIVGIDIPIALPEIDERLVFDPEPMVFDAPEPPADDDGGLDESGTGWATGVWDSESDGATEGTGSGTETEGGGSGGVDGLGDGCGCRSGSPRGGMAVMPMLLALGGIRRRARLTPARPAPRARSTDPRRPRAAAPRRPAPPLR
ncbi:hypothetical protein [Paraliomyxa miuraensis]|uniref:hypothetical protein n=1 Tax=Paraliomyxa miuraensis TaxID=376150 RepID=UPI00225BDECA|nr:hypothetical protein [Paraliomyxa miuraensis]MCX4242755.1 hypothetical protein [Paraliomyxa miuraensis]